MTIILFFRNLCQAPFKQAGRGFLNKAERLKGIKMAAKSPLTKPALPNIFDYNDFRKYLSDYQAARHAFDKTFTKSYLCKKLGIENSRGYFGDVIAGKPVTASYISRFVKVLELGKDESQFFRVLVKFNQSEYDPEERELYFDQLISLNKTPTKVIDPKAYAYYKDWHNAALRAILNIFDCAGKDDVKSLAKKVFPPITPKQTLQSLSLMEQLGLVAKNEMGFYKPTDKAITTGPYVQSELVKQYQIKSLELARYAILRNKKSPQKISTKMISISNQGYERIVDRLKRFDSELRSLVHKDENPADRVYQLDILFFPTSQ